MYKTFIPALFSILFASCITMNTINIDVLEPASNPVTPDIENAVLLNRMIIVNSDDSRVIGNSVFRIIKRDISGTRPNDTIVPENTVIESYNQITTEVIFSLADILNESPGINHLPDSALLEVPESDSGITLDPLDAGFVKRNTELFGADGIISLENFYVEYNDTITINEGDAETGWYNYYIGSINLIINALWRTYTSSDGEVIDEYEMRDTLQWTNASFTRSLIFEGLPTLDEALLESAYFTALNVARRISPYWMLEERYYFSRGNYDFRMASHYLINGQWDNAETIYMNLLNRRNYTIRAAAYYNLALLNELKGDFRQALVYARKSYQAKILPVTIKYIDILEERSAKSRELDRQLGITS